MKTVVSGLLTPFLIYTLITVLHLIIPGRNVLGYVTNPQTGQKLRYRLNGRLILILSIILWAVSGYFKLIPFGWLYHVRFYSLAGAFVIGLVFSFISVFPFPSTGKHLIADFFFGRLENPQFRNGKIDAKMWLYLVGAIMLELNTLSYAFFHYMTYGNSSSIGVFICAALISYFVFDYLSFEEVHLYTYDFFAEKVGFKLGWGCLTFYPFFYSIALFTTAHLPDPGRSLRYSLTAVFVFFCGWILARGANMQKFYFKTDPEKAFLGIKPETITDGKRTLLVNGFWGVSRHINYLGEILMAVGITLSVGYPLNLPGWLYPLYYIALLFTRQYADDKRCSAKYGPLWAEYETRVKYRIIPFIY